MENENGKQIIKRISCTSHGKAKKLLADLTHE